MEIAKSLLEAAKNHPEEGHRIESLHQLIDILFQNDNPLLATEFFRQCPDLQASPSIAIRQQLPEIIRKIVTKAPGYLREAVFALTALLNDGAQDVVRLSICNATLLFQTALNGESKTWQNDQQSLTENFGAAVGGLVHRQGISDGVKFVAVKSLEKIILLLAAEEASKNLGFMVELLTAKFAVTKTSVSIVVIKSLVEIAKRRPEFCGRVLQVLVDLNPDVKSARGHIGSLVYAFKAAFLALLRCPHWGSLPWRDRLLGILRGMNFGEVAEQAIRRADRALKEKKRQTREVISSKTKAAGKLTWTEAKTAKKADVENLADVEEEGLAPALQKLKVRQPEVEQEERDKTILNGSFGHVDKVVSGSVDVDQIVAMLGAMLEEGEKGCKTIEIVISNMNPDLLADVVIANMSNLPSSPADVSTVFQIGTSGVLSRVVPST